MNVIDKNQTGSGNRIRVYCSDVVIPNGGLRIGSTDETLGAYLQKGLHAVLPSVLKTLGHEDGVLIEIGGQRLVAGKVLAAFGEDVAAEKASTNPVDGYLGMKFQKSDPTAVKAWVRLAFDASGALQSICIIPEYEGSNDSANLPFKNFVHSNSVANDYMNAMGAALHEIGAAIHERKEQMRLLKLSNRKK